MSKLNYFQVVGAALARLPSAPIEEIIIILKLARNENRRVFIFGNGGSAATASHFAVDMLKAPAQTRLKIICLNDNMPTVTAYANDVSYDVIFAEPLSALAETGDVVMALSGSGNSPNILRALEVAEQRKLLRIGLTGFAGGKMKALCDVCAVVPSDSQQAIEDLHLVILHHIFLAMME